MGDFDAWIGRERKDQDRLTPQRALQWCSTFDLDPPGEASAGSAPSTSADASSAERLDEWVTDRVDQRITKAINVQPRIEVVAQRIQTLQAAQD